MAQRNYHSGDINALYMWSGGLCYKPKCKTPIVEETDGEMVSQVEIAHIHALKKNGSRYVVDMTDEQRNSHKNLILLCVRHHKIVDRMSNEAKYPAAQLFQWKRDREGNMQDALRGLEGMTEAKFDQMLVDSVVSAKDELLDAIEALPARIDERIVQTLKSMVDQSFKQPRLDIGAIDMLSSTVSQLDKMRLAETAEQLNIAAYAIEDAARKLPPQ